MAAEGGIPTGGGVSGEITLDACAEVFSAVNGMFCVYDLEGQILHINKKFIDLLSYPEETLYKMNISGLAFERQRRRVREVIRQQAGQG